MTVLGHRPPQWADVDDTIDDVYNGGHRTYVARANEDVRAGDDARGIGSPLEECPRQPRLVHGVQVDEQVDRVELVAHCDLPSRP